MTDAGTPTSLCDLRAELRTRGLLLHADPALPSVAGRIAGKPLHGPWSAHPCADQIRAALDVLAGDPDALSVRLVRRKPTFVHRALWPHLLAIAGAREPWQLAALSPAARELLRRVEERGALRLDRLRGWSCALKPAAGARELEERLLVRADATPDESRALARTLERWEDWGARVRIEVPLPALADAKRALEHALPGAPRSAFPW
jgi:hypothetical protein